MKKAAILMLAIFATGFAGGLVAQVPGHRVPPRVEDHFQRNLVSYRIDLSEKMNEPMVHSENPALYAEGAYGESKGIVMSLLNGLKSGKFLAYHPDSLGKALTWEDVEQIAWQNQGDGPEIWDEEEGEGIWDEEETEEIWDEDGGETSEDALETEWDEDLGSGLEEIDFSAYETVLEFIENRIFDKNRSDIVHDIQYIRLVWVDPGETLPDKNFVCLKYSDVLETLEDTQWKNKFNDAEDRNLREVFELRMFNGFLTSLSGRGVRTLPESAFRSDQLTEFEHHLWSY